MDNYPETDSTVVELPSTLRWLRKMRGLKLREVAEIASLSISFLSDVERGRSRPSLDTLARLVNTYQAPIRLKISIKEETANDMPTL